ncbi:MAG: hypothetical protein Q8O92_02485 [Candidatus Latescibacter sp.]|nr:hypothetical protein [Candidatus Latescibacter sp.]
MSRLMNGVSAGCILLTLAGAAEVQEAKVSINDLLGDWLNKTYVDSLRKTLSPRASVKGIYYTAIRFTKIHEGFKWIIDFNFHEGLPYTIDSLKVAGTDTYSLIFNKEEVSGRETMDDRIVFPDGSFDDLSWVFTDKGKEQRIRFIRVRPSMEKFVNRIVLAGTYTDTSGRRFLFTDDSEAKWPNKTFIYEIGLDCVLAHCDHFSIPAEKDTKGAKFYAYERKNDKLYLYNTVFLYDVIMEPEGSPLYVLTRKRK